MKLSPSQSLARICEPIFATRTEEDLGIGDTEEVRQMIDWCHRHPLNILQTLPINEISDDNSPCKALSSLVIEPATIAISPRHIPDLPPASFRELARPEMLAELRPGPVNYPAVKALKRKLLEAAFESFHQAHFDLETERALQFRSFLMQNADGLSDYSLFRALTEENGDFPTWDRWAPEHRSPRTARTWLLSLPEKRRDE